GWVGEDCVLCFSEAEYRPVDAFIAREGLSRGFVVVELDTNRDSFGELRAWPRERWLIFVQSMRAAHPALAVVQIGVAGGPPLPGGGDLRGETALRIARGLLKRSRPFVGPQGGPNPAPQPVGAQPL